MSKDIFTTATKKRLENSKHKWAWSNILEADCFRCKFDQHKISTRFNMINNIDAKKSFDSFICLSVLSVKYLIKDIISY